MRGPGGGEKSEEEAGTKGIKELTQRCGNCFDVNKREDSH